MRINIFNLLFVFTLIVVAESTYLIMKPPLAAEVPFGDPKPAEQVIAEAEAQRQAEVLAAMEAANKAQVEAAEAQAKLALQNTVAKPTTVKSSVSAVKTTISASKTVPPPVVAAPNFGSSDKTPPTAPTALSVLSLTDVQVNLVWKASTDNVGVAGYRIWRNGVYIGTTTNTKYAVINLLPQTEYSFSVSAYDAAGNRSPESMKVLTATYPKLGVPTPNGLSADPAAVAPAPTPTPTPTPTPAGSSADVTPPTVPTGLSTSATSYSQVALSWTASTDDTGVAGYYIYRNGTQVGTAVNANYGDSGLTGSTLYSYTVAAYDAAGNVSAQSSASTVTTAAPPAVADTTAPTAPTGLTATSISLTQIIISWTASTDNVAVTQYRVHKSYTATVSTVTAPTTTYTSTGRTPNTTYTFTVEAVDAAGNVSPLSAPLSVTTLADTTAPTVPTGLTATTISATQINLAWSASTDNVGIAGYKVYRDGTLRTTLTGTGRTFNDTGLTGSTLYSYTVTAYDAAGNESTQSTAATATTATPDLIPPTAPTNLVATAISSTVINLSWTASTDNVGVIRYDIYRVGRTTPYNPTPLTGTTYSNTGRTPSTTYTYTVVAVDAAGNTATSTSASATTPAAPVAVAISVTATSINPLSVTIPVGSTVTWTNTTPGSAVVYTFSPSTGAPAAQQITLDTATPSRSFTFLTAGTYTYADPNVPAVVGTIIVQ